MQESFDFLGDAPVPERLAAIEAGAHRISIGTCGYSYAEWVGPFYPRGTKQPDMLAYYAERFDALEIDSSYYGVPKRGSMEKLVRVTGETFRVALKLPGTLTHDAAEGSPLHPDAGLFAESIAPLAESGKLAVLLAQFPGAFRPNDATRDHLRVLRDAFPDVALAVEFRHRDWQTNDTLELLASLDLAWTNVDEPHFDTLLRPASDVTGPVGYVRFHGRSAATWWKPDTPGDRYTYDYSIEELEPWSERVLDIAGAAPETFAFFNNHRFGSATIDARKLAALVRSRLAA